MRSDHDEEPVDTLRDEPAVRNGSDRRRVEHDVVVTLPRFVDERVEPRGLEQLVRRAGRPARRHYREVDLGEMLHHVLEREA